MCTLILASRVLPSTPLFFAGNRDEDLSRAASEPLIWDASPRFVAPRDEMEGGTWLGVNENGVLVAITNRFGGPRDGTRRSRGALVVDALGASSAEAAAETAAGHAPDAHNPFHLLMADAESAHMVYSDGEAITRFEMEPGIYVVTERSFGAAANGRAAFIEHMISELQESDALTKEAIVRQLAVARDNDIDATTVRIPERNYGTRSSTVFDFQRRYFGFADGPPTQNDYVDYSDLLQSIWR